MAVYRNISMNFWTDTKVVDDFTPEDKYFMLYCLTNPYTNLCGCYEISIKQIARDIGYKESVVKELLDKFKNQYGIIDYEPGTKEMLVKNWNKYNWSTSNKLDKPLFEEIQKIKTPLFHNYLAEIYNKRDTVSIRYRYGIYTVRIVYR